MHHELKHEGEVIARFELPEDLTQGQLESYEAKTRQIIDKAKEKTDAVLCRAVLSGAFAVGMLSEIEGGPVDAEGIPGASTRVSWWMTETISKFVAGLKAVPPNS